MIVGGGMPSPDRNPHFFVNILMVPELVPEHSEGAGVSCNAKYFTMLGDMFSLVDNSTARSSI